LQKKNYYSLLFFYKMSGGGGGGPSRSLYIPNVPFDTRELEADTLEHLCLQEAGAHVRLITNKQLHGKRVIFIDFFSTAACERAKCALEKEYSNISFYYGKDKNVPNDQVVFELLRPMHPDMDRENLKRFIKEYGFTLTRMEPSVQSAHKWLLTFDDIRDVDFVLRRMNGQRYDGGEVYVCRARK
jgi:hypothetical protein